jgi:glycosyltransferase involved in cell wall biosynthesis
VSAQQLAFIAPRFSAEATVGGAETLLKNLALCAAEAGRDVTFLTTCATDHFTWKNELPPGAETVGGLAVRRFPVDEDRDVATFHKAQNAICSGAAVSRETELDWIRHSVNSHALMDHLAAEGGRYDRLIMGPYLFGVIYHAALAHAERTLLVPCLHDEAFAGVSIMRDLFRSVRGCLFNSEPEAALARRLYGLAPDFGTVVGMAMDPFEAGGRAIEEPYVLYSGRREPMKGTPLLCEYLDAFRARTGRDVKLVLTGSGPVDAPESLRPHIRDLGFVSEEEKHRAMAGAEAFVHPSVNESFGIVLLESWLAGTPALVHAGGEVLRWQCRRSRGGLWFRFYPDFEEALLFLLDRPDAAAAMGKSGRDYVVREYARESVRRRLLNAADEETAV